MRAARWLLSLALLAPRPALAQVGPTPPLLGPSIEAALGRALTIPPAPGHPTGHAHAVLEVRDVADLGRLSTLPGVEVATSAGVPIHHGRFAVARIDAEGLRSLSTASFVVRARLAPPAGIPPLERSAERLNLSAAHAGPMADGTYGRGVLVADIDAPLDPFHPAFFHADGGAFGWIDVDGNGSLGAGDAIDLDGDGAAGEGESASLLLASPVDFYGATAAELRGGAGFDPGIDWVYLDTNGNAVRDVGAAGGFDDTAPGLGEPLFVPDDVDRDRRLDPDERLFRLSTSKIRAMRIDVRDYGFPLTEYVRGTNLSAAQRDYTGGAYGYADTLHGSGVAGILLADVPLIGRRWVGIAPEAEIVLASDIGETNIDGFMWALSQGPSVVIHEYVEWTNVALDGSDPTSMLIDETTAEGIAHACPAGNIGGEGKHAMAEVRPGAVTVFPFEVSTTYLVLSLHLPIGSNPTITLVEASGARHSYGSPTRLTLSDGTELFWQEQDTGRTHRSASFIAYAPAGLPPGRWSLEVESGAGARAVMAHAFLADENGFARGTDFVDESDTSTMAWPSTADGCLALGAYPAHLGSEGVSFRGDEADGEVRAYSARGPRIDGAQSIDVIAPDNPLSPLGAGDALPSSPGAFLAPEGAYQIFGGTSGAGPHVAGVLMLLSQRGVHGAEAVQRVIDSAIGDPIAGTLPNDDYGHGRLDAAGALGVAAAGNAPHVTLTAQRDGEGARITPIVEDEDGGALSVRWDLDYDGAWDTELEAAAPRTLTVPAWIKVEVQDATGRRDQAVLRVTSLGSLGPDGGVSDGGTGPAGGDGCGCRAGARPVSPLGLGVLVLLVMARRWRAK